MKTIDQWLEEAGGRAYVDEEGWEECARHLERKMAVMRSCLSEAENELRCFGSFDGHIARWEQRIAGTANDEFRGGCKPSSGTSCSAMNGGTK